MRIALSKGRLQTAIIACLSRAGVSIVFRHERDYHPVVDPSWMRATLIKPRAIPQNLSLGHFDLGFCGLDVIRDSSVFGIRDLGSLPIGAVRIVAAVPASKVNILRDPPNRPFVIATEYPNIADEWAYRRGLAHITVNTYGGTEAYARDLADVVIDCTETGATLAANDLVIVDELFTSTVRIVASEAALCRTETNTRVLQLRRLLMEGVT